MFDARIHRVPLFQMRTVEQWTTTNQHKYIMSAPIATQTGGPVRMHFGSSLGSKLTHYRLTPQPSFDVMARDMSLLLLLVASALAAQDATSGPIHSSLRGAVGNSSEVESTGGVKCCKHKDDTTHCHSEPSEDAGAIPAVCRPSENYPEAQCAFHGLGWALSQHCCTPDDVGIAWVFGGCH